MTNVVCYPTQGKKKAFRMCTEFAQGAEGDVAPVGYGSLMPGPAFFYGMTEHTLPLIDKCKSEEREWFYADNAYYFGRGKYFRITRGHLMHDGKGWSAGTRFEKFKVRLKKYNRDGKYILITTQSELFYSFRLGIDRSEWTKALYDELRQQTDREIVVCHKPDAMTMSSNQPHSPSFEELLSDAWCVVTHSSSTAVGALINGIPTFCTAPCMANTMSGKEIEKPYYPDNRWEWLSILADNQWDRAEMRSGRCWRDLYETKE